MAGVILALYEKSSRPLGAAYYCCRQNRLFVLQETQDIGLDSLVVHVQPTTILVPKQFPDSSLSSLQNSSGLLDGEDTLPQFSIHHLPASDFDYAASVCRLTRILPDVSQGSLPEVDHHHPGQQLLDQSRLESFVDSNCRFSIGCAGALIGVIQLGSAGGIPDILPDSPIYPIKSLELFTLNDFMLVNRETLLSLQVIGPGKSPQQENLGQDRNHGQEKEYLSLLGIFRSYASTLQGKERLRQLLLRPLKNVDLIQGWQGAVTVFLESENVESLDRIRKILCRVRDIRMILAQLKKGIDCPSRASLDWDVWSVLHRFSTSVSQLYRELSQLKLEESAIVQQIIRDLRTSSILSVGDAIGRTIDFDSSRLHLRSVIARGVDPDLDTLTRRYDGLETFLNRVSADTCAQLPPILSKHLHGAVFLPQFGFLMVVSPSGRATFSTANTPGIDTWEPVFNSEHGVFFKNSHMRELDLLHGDIYHIILDREVELLHALLQQVNQWEPALFDASDACGQLDSILAFAMVARRFNWVAPRVVQQNVIDVHEGRHPLQELIVPAYIPSSYRIPPRGQGNGGLDQIQADHESIIIVTGPNQSGKSVLLKQVGIITYLAHIGSYVPAKEASIGITDKIIARICTRESLLKSESAFGIDLRQALFSLRAATSQSLLLIDEFGKGTKHDDGIGLFAALVRHFLSRGVYSPRVVMTTHFSEILREDMMAIIPRTVSCMQMKVRVMAGTTDRHLTYLYQLMPGHETESFGLECARLNGIRDDVVNRARIISDLTTSSNGLSYVLVEPETHDLRVAETILRDLV